MKYVLLGVCLCFAVFVCSLAGWHATLTLAACMAGMVLLGLIVKQLTGAHAYLLEDWKYEPGETIVWQDDRADAYPLGRMGQAVFMSALRWHRDTVVATNRRILVAQKGLFSKKRLIRYVFNPGPSADGYTKHLGGGALTVGYQTIAYTPGVMVHGALGKHARIELAPLEGDASSTNLSKLLIYTELSSTFQLP